MSTVLERDLNRNRARSKTKAVKKEMRNGKTDRKRVDIVERAGWKEITIEQAGREENK